MESFEIIAAGGPSRLFDGWVETLNRAGVWAKRIAIAEQDRERGHTRNPHPREDEVHILVPVDRVAEALATLKAHERPGAE